MFSKRRPSSKLYRDEVPIEEDFFAIGSQVIGLDSRGSSYSRNISPSKKKPAIWSTGKAWVVEDRDDVGLDENSQQYEMALEGGVFDTFERQEGTKPIEKAKKTLRSARPHQYWRTFERQEFLDEMLRYQGRGDSRNQDCCWECLSQGKEIRGEPLYRCRNCYLRDLVCSDCCRERHVHNPLHVVERWNSIEFQRVPLKDLGVKIQLNHLTLQCSNPVRGHRKLRILHWGMHEVDLLFCGCSKSIPHHRQLLRRGFYPSTTGDGRITTVASFEYLEYLHHLTVTTRASAYDLFRALARATDNTGLQDVPWRYRALMRMQLQWRHLKVLMRSGRGHDDSGVAGTKEGELVVPCPSCPRPGINLPDGWELDSKNRYLYALRVTMDANFRLKEQLVSSHSRDPGLCDGEGYFVRRGPYEKHVLSRAHEADISHCVGFAAMAQALTKFSTGLRYTGVGAVACARGEMLLPNGVGNMQLGERYPNMDYLIASVLNHFKLLVAIVGYDIACQWFIHLRERIDTHWPEHLRKAAQMILVPVIGKFHEPAHKVASHEQFSANLALWMGLCDFEALERIWGLHNQLGNSTKTMGPGTRIDTLECHFGFHNWEKYKKMGETLWTKYIAALKDRNLQREAHREFSEMLPPELVKRWEILCKAWEEAPYPKSDVESPFPAEEEFMTEAEVEKELAAEDEAQACDNKRAKNRTSAAKFVMLGLDLEDSQVKLRAEVKAYSKSLKTGRQTAGLLDRRRVLMRNIRNFQEVRAVYMPGLLQFLTDTGEAVLHGDDDVQQEDVKLWLPSAIPDELRDSVCADEVAAIEGRLRHARCYDALGRLRHTLRVKTRMILFKNANVRGQRQSGRSRAVIDRIHDRAREAAEKYRTNREALLKLWGPGEWEEKLKQLKTEDVRVYSEPAKVKKKPGRRGIIEEDAVMESGVNDNREQDDQDLCLFEAERTREEGTGETRREISWIWRVAAISLEDGADGQDNAILRGEWARSRARAARATEEVLLLREEMRRTGVFLIWKAAWWQDRAAARPGVDKGLAEGLRAYASKQGRIQKGLAAKFGALWKTDLNGTSEVESKEDRLAREEIGLADGEGRDRATGDDEEEVDADEEMELVEEAEGHDGGDLDAPDRPTEAGEDEVIEEA